MIIEMTDVTLNDLAEVFYSTYCESVGGTAFNGEPLPEWIEFKMDPNKKRQSNAYIDATRELVDAVVLRLKRDGRLK